MQTITTNQIGIATQLIKASSVEEFVTQLDASAKTLTNRSMAYLGLWGAGAVLDTVGTVETLGNLKVGEKLDIEMSNETRACNAALIKSIHLVGNDIVVNGAENLFAFVQAEQVVRAVAAFLRATGATNVIFGGVPAGHGAWLLPKAGAPVALSSFGLGWVLPYEGHLLAADLIGGGCFYLSPAHLARYELGRHFWTSFYTPAAGVRVLGFGHRVRDGYLYATLRNGMTTVVEAWNVLPLLSNKAIVTNAVEVKPEWRHIWGADMIGPVEQGIAIAVVAPNTTGVTFYGIAAPRA